jgi:hypothetical protein
MYTIYVLLFLGAFVPFALIAMLVVGSLIHSVSLGKDVLKAMSRTRNVKAAGRSLEPAPQLRRPAKAVPAEISVPGDVAYAAA